MDMYNCATCHYKDIPESDKPCSECYDSFGGRPFCQPSKWELKRLSAKNTEKCPKMRTKHTEEG